VTHPRRRPIDPSRRSRPVALLAAVVLTTGLLATPVAAAPPAAERPAPASAGVAAPLPGARTRPAAPADDAPELPPSVQYEDAMAHEQDAISFEPGKRVSVGFSPRATDTWPIDGRAPRPLPAGRLSGLELARTPQGESTGETAAPASAPVDGAAAEPSTVQSAMTTSVVDPASADPLDTGATGLRRQVFGFLPYWELSDSSTSLDYSVLSTVAYFSVGSDKNGNLLKKAPDGSTTTGWGGWTSSRMTNVINAAHQKGTRVVLTISMFAWTTSQKASQGALLGNPTARLNLARQAAAAVHDRGADGINLDFEPIATGYADEYVAFVKSVRAELNKLASGYQLTFDTTGYIGNYPLEGATAAGAADAVFVMGYDYRTAGSGSVGSISPVAGNAYDLNDTIKAYRARVPASKLILGIPYYGRAWSTDTDKLHAKNISGTKYGSSVTAVYSTAIELAAEHGRRWDDVEKSPYTVYRRENCTSTYGCVTSWRQLYYDDAQSLKIKYDLINSYGLRGAGIWALGYDDGRSELNNALAAKFRAPMISASSISSTAFSPNGDGAKDKVIVSVTATSYTSWGFTAAPLAGGQPGAVIRSVAGTGTPTVGWDGRTDGGSIAPDGSYRITLWVEDAFAIKTSKTWDVVLDTRAPAASSAAEPPLFSPNGDGFQDTTRLAWSADEAASGKVRVRTSTGSLKVWAVGQSGSLVWDGRASTKVYDGRYVFQVDLTDAAGNRTVREIALVVDRTTSGFAVTPNLFYPQDGDRYGASTRVGFRLSRSAITTLKIHTQDGTYVKTAWTGRSSAAGNYSWTWNGKNGKGALVAPGWYRATLWTRTALGTTRQHKLLLVDAYSLSPSSWSLTAGQTLTVNIRSAEPLSTTPRLTFSQAGAAAVVKTATSVGGGRYRVTFTVAAGATGPATIVATARDAAGRTNTGGRIVVSIE
jgi:spore germination protein YaaH